MTEIAFTYCRDALHTLLEGVTGYLTSANVADNDHGVIDKGLDYAAVLSKGSTETNPSAEGTVDRFYEVLVECFKRYTTEAETSDALEKFVDAVTAKIDENPTLKGTPWIVANGTLVTAVDEPLSILVRGAPAGSVPVFLMCTIHVQIEYHRRITGGEFRR